MSEDAPPAPPRTGPDPHPSPRTEPGPAGIAAARLRDAGPAAARPPVAPAKVVPAKVVPARPPPGAEPVEARLRRRLGTRSIVLVGLMGAGKSTVGRRLAARLGLMFRDADQEIEAAAGLTIPDIFAIYGEASFRDGEERVIARLLREGPMVLATGGGAYLREGTRARVGEAGVSVWLRAELDVLMRRVRKRPGRPLLQTADPEATMRDLMAARHPVYAAADLAVESRDVSHDRVAADILLALDRHLGPTDGVLPGRVLPDGGPLDGGRTA